jgi:3-oxoacyl-[acyl-carrier protein] reductase
MDFPDLKDRVALVTGAAGAMGMATVRALLADGMRVAMADIDSVRLSGLAREFGTNAIAVPFDVADPLAAEEAVARIESDAGAVDVLVNNAGILSRNKAAETTPEEWRRVLSINLDGAFYLARRTMPGMRERGWGRIVNVCSLAMKSGGLAAGTAYTASKGALAALTFSLARETAPYGVTVNGIAPGYVHTAMITEHLSEAQRQAMLMQIPVGRFCEPEEFAHCVRFLVSPLSGFITGEILDLNGGFHFD